MKKYHEKETAKYNATEEALCKLLLGEKLTKCNINALLTEGYSLSAEDILKRLRADKIELKHKRRDNDYGDTTWRMAGRARKEYLKSPAALKYIKIGLFKDDRSRAPWNKNKKVGVLMDIYGYDLLRTALFTHHN